MRATGPLVLILVTVAALAATGRPTAHTTPSAVPSAHVAGASPGHSTDDGGPVTGPATFYADDFHGLPMANGAIYDMDDATTAASNSWPLGTRLRVRRVAGGPWDSSLTAAERATFFARSLEITVTDRGDFTHPLDLSRGAFARLGRLDEGVIQVRVERIDEQPPPAITAAPVSHVSLLAATNR